MSVYSDLIKIKQTQPIVHNVTNLVVMQTTANMLLAIGASPIMAHALNELADIINLAQALVINIGTLDDAWIKSITHAQQLAQARGIPIVFDPVGAGASQYRTETAKRIIQNKVDIIRGNSAEIMALTDIKVKSKGVDCTQSTEDALFAARELATQYHCVVVVSGAIDYIIDAKREFRVTQGTPLLTKVTGMGCSATALIAAFAAVNQDYTLAANYAMLTMGKAGEMAAQKAPGGPGSFAVALLDTLANLQLIDFENIVQ